MNTGDLKWFGRSGVPGLGVSVENHYYDVPDLKHWDEDANTDLKHPGKDDQKQPRQSLSDKIVSMFNLRRRNTFKNPSETQGSRTKVSVKRSQSMVTTSKKKLGLSDKRQTGDICASAGPGPVPPPRTNIASDKQLYCDSRQSSLSTAPHTPLKQNLSTNNSFICQNCINNSKVSVKRSVSYHERGRKEAKKQSLHRSGTVIVSNKPPPSSISTTSSNKVPKNPKNSTNCVGKQRIEEGRGDKSGSNLSTIATQTEDHYDYAYSSLLTPAMMIKMNGGDSNQGQEEEEAANIYEEIIPPDKRLFYSISKGRRENLELYKFADWDLEEKLKEPKTDKDNYIKPREIKSSLNKKSSLRKLKTKEQRNVTFASDEDCERVKTSLQRSKSVNVSSHTSSKHN